MKKNYSPAENPELTALIVDSCVQFCDIIIFGKEGAAALKYDEENMFAPMIVLLEKDASATALVRTAEKLDVPVIKNISLMKTLSSYGKAGETIPEVSFRDVSLALARLGRNKRRSRGVEKRRKGIPIKIPRPLSVEMGNSIYSLTGEDPGREKLLSEPLNSIRRRLIKLLGITIPFFRISHNPKLRDDEYRLLFKGLEAGRGKLELGWYSGETARGAPCGVIPEMMSNPDNVKAAAKAASSMLVRHANEIIQRRAPELLGRD
ncbi:MAG: EscU/YscU/HrcU family type III secretion system export apparatus switch protein, partial [Treponema sp.]|nr:EscU/YscU/HrcU family type III secretion system export apparatus switch protein [Treponema sp.]